MAAPEKPSRKASTARGAAATGDVETLCSQAIAALRSHASEAARAGMARYAIPSDKAFGMSMRDVQAVAKQFGRNHALAEALWQSDIYEARMLACYVDDPAQVSAAQMDRWARDFENWAHCDTACFVLFDRSAHAWKKVTQWASRREEFIKRAAFALLASLTVHDKQAADANYLHGLELIEAAASDERNFVKKAVNWALRSIGKRNATLHAAAVAVAQRLAEAKEAAPRWVGKDALRELRSDAVVARVAARKAKARRA